MEAALHPQQELRLAALRRYDILDTPRESDFDEIVELTAKLCEAPIAVVNLIDAGRQWFKAEVGLGVRETPLETSLCAHVILERDFVEIPDTLADPRMSDNPLCLADGGLRFYAGVLLKSAEGLPIGTLCVLDTRPRSLTDLQRQAIKTLARQVMTQLDLRRALAAEQIQRNEIDHRVKNSLAAVAGYVALERRGVDDGEARLLLDRVAQQINTVALLHRQLSDAGSQQVDLGDYLSEVIRLIHSSLADRVDVQGAFDPFPCGARNASVLGTIVNELVANAVKHGVRGQSDSIRVSGVREQAGRYRLICESPASAASAEPIEHSKRSGLGLKLIANSVRQIGGTLTTHSDEDCYRTTIVIPQHQR